MEHPVRVAFCPVLFAANGGRFDDLGRPIAGGEEERIRGKCDTPYDCGSCPFMVQWVQSLVEQGWSVGWECYQCLKDTKAVERKLPGFYQAGRDPDMPVDEDGWDNSDPDLPGLRGCTRCGYQTSFLQLVLRR